MKKMSTTAKVLSVLAKIIMIMSIVCGSILVVAAIVLLFMDASIFEGSTADLILGSVSFTVTPESAPDFVLAKWQSFGILISAAVMVFFGAYFMKTARKALKPVSEQNPFDAAVYTNIKKLGIQTIVFGVIMQLIMAAVEISTLAIYDFDKLFINEYITAYDLDMSFDGSFVIVAIVLFMLSGVFKYGAELQKQSDETL